MTEDRPITPISFEFGRKETTHDGHIDLVLFGDPTTFRITTLSVSRRLSS